MPFKSKKPCKHPGCPELTHNRFCSKHEKEYERSRGSASERGYDKRWQNVRMQFLSLYPLCHDCLEQKRLTRASDVHHIKKLRDGGTHDFSNLMALCGTCHKKKTAKGE